MKIQHIKNLIFWISIRFILFWIITAFLGLFILLEIRDSVLRAEYFNVRLFGIPIAIFLTFISSIKKTETTSDIISKMVGAILLPPFVCFILFLSTMCQYQYADLFLDRENSEVKIIKRSLGCGATDTEAPKWNNYKEVPVTDYFTYFLKVDTTQLDKTKWKKITFANKELW